MQIGPRNRDPSSKANRGHLFESYGIVEFYTLGQPQREWEFYE